MWLPGFCTLIHLLLIVLIWLSLVCSQIKIEPPPTPTKARRFAWLQKSFHVCRQPTGIQGRSLKGKRTFSELWSRAELNRAAKQNKDWLLISPAMAILFWSLKMGPSSQLQSCTNAPTEPFEREEITPHLCPQ